jgi:hypothetical protein
VRQRLATKPRHEASKEARQGPIRDELETIMTRILLGATCSVLLALPALAQDLKTGTTGETALQQPAIELAGAPNSRYAVAAGAARPLARHGDRYEKAMKLIEAEALKPGWGWEDGCGHDDRKSNLMPNS